MSNKNQEFEPTKKPFYVTITERLERTVMVIACDKDEALEIAEDNYKQADSEEYTLNASDYIGTDFSCDGAYGEIDMEGNDGAYDDNDDEDLEDANL